VKFLDWGIRLALALFFLSAATIFHGCQSKPLVLPTAAALAEFDRAGPIRPEVDMDRLIQAQMPAGTYRVVVGDVLEFTLPALLRTITADFTEPPEAIRPHLCRVVKSGDIYMPVVGKIAAANQTLPEIESLIVNAYYPKYIAYPPAVVGRVAEFRVANVSVVGEVKNPGMYGLRSDEMSLVALLTKANGIAGGGAGMIRIHRAGDDLGSKPVILPVKGTNIPFADVALQEGDMVEVEGLKPEFFTVIGLVQSSGAFPYPPETQFNLWQALAFAGGLDMIADPRYVRVYRQAADGRIVDATFKITGTEVNNAYSTRIKRGDVVAVEHTDRTRQRVLISQIVRFGTGASLLFRIDN